MAPIHDACCKGDVAALRRELDAGVSPDLRGHTLLPSAVAVPGDALTDATPLYMSVCWGHIETTRLLLDAGADVEAVISPNGERGYTAISIAAYMRRPDAVAALIAAGASTSLKMETTHARRTPIENICGPLYVANGAKRVFAMLLRAGAPLPRFDDVELHLPGVPYCRTLWWEDEDDHRDHAVYRKYVDAVAAAGGYVPYARAHRKRLAAIFAPKFTWLPAEVIPTIVEFWAHLGHP
jgi:hypothetical protein